MTQMQWWKLVRASSVATAGLVLKAETQLPRSRFKAVLASEKADFSTFFFLFARSGNTNLSLLQTSFTIG